MLLHGWVGMGSLQPAHLSLLRDSGTGTFPGLDLQPGQDDAAVSAWLERQDNVVPVPTVPAEGRAKGPSFSQDQGSLLSWLSSHWAQCFPLLPPTGIQELNSPLCSVNLTAVETNIVMVKISGGCPSPAELCEHLWAVSEEELAKTGHAVSVLLFPWSAHTVRAVWHRDVSARDTELAKKKLEFVARKCQEKLTLGLRPTPPSAGGA